MNKLKVKSFFSSLIVLSLFLNVKFVSAAGLVPCGGYEEDGVTLEPVCTMCHLIVGMYGIVERIRDLTIYVALFVITLAGVMWIVSAGGDLAKTAKNAITNTIIGVVIMLSAWLIIVFLLSLISYKPENITTDNPNKLIKNGVWEFSCSTTAFIGGEDYGKPKCGSDGTCDFGTVSEYKHENVAGGTIVSWSCSTETDSVYCEIERGGTENGSFMDVKKSNDAIYKKLTDKGVTVTSTSGSSSMCRGESSTSKSGCITLYGLKNDTVDMVTEFKDKCTNCNVKIVSATDKIVDTDGKTYCNEVHAGCGTSSTTSHDSGNKVDIQGSGTIEYVEKNFEPAGTVKIKGKTYKRYKNGSDYWIVEGTHLDACSNCAN